MLLIFLFKQKVWIIFLGRISFICSLNQYVLVNNSNVCEAFVVYKTQLPLSQIFKGLYSMALGYI